MEHWKSVIWLLALGPPYVHFPLCKCLSLLDNGKCHTLSGTWACHLGPSHPARPHWCLIGFSKWFQEANDATEYLKSGCKGAGNIQVHPGETEEGDRGEVFRRSLIPWRNPDTRKSSWGFSYSNHLGWPLHQVEILNRKIPRQGSEPWQGKGFWRWMKEYSKWEITEQKRCFKSQFARLQKYYSVIYLVRMNMGCEETSLLRCMHSSPVELKSLNVQLGAKFGLSLLPFTFFMFNRGCDAMGVKSTWQSDGQNNQLKIFPPEGANENHLVHLYPQTVQIFKSVFRVKLFQ